MSSEYAISITINNKFNLDNIKAVLEKGINLGCSYYQVTLLNKDGECELSPLDINTMLQNIEHARISDDIYPITVHAENSYLDLLFINNNNHLCMLFSGMSPEWSKQYSDGSHDIDIYRYIQFTLKIANDAQLLNMEISKD